MNRLALKQIISQVKVPKSMMAKAPIELKRPIKTSYGTELFKINGISYEKTILPNGGEKILNLDTGAYFDKII